MTVHLNTQADLEDAVHALVKQDPRLQPILKLAGMPALRRRGLLPDSASACVFDYAAQIASETNPEGLRRATRMLQLADNRPLLPKLKMPILVLTGEMDTDVQPILKADLLKLAPAPMTKHVEMPGLGHAPYFEAPDYFNSLIEDFLSEK